MRSLKLIALACMAGFAFQATAQEATSPAPAAQGSGNLPGDVYWGNTGVESLRPMSNPPQSVNDVLSSSILNPRKNQSEEIPWVRAQAIQEAAAAFGAQAGLSARARHINNELRVNAVQYDKVFNFSAVMLEPGFLPPVISEGRDAYNQPSDFQVRAADRIYKIEFPARLVNVPPRWQDYLFVSESTPMAPDRTSLPKTASEKALWDEWAARGWQQGESLAEETFRSNMGRLKRDFEGMLRYKTLYAQGLVTKPIMAKSNLGVTGGGDEMAINDRIYEVTDKARLNPDRSRWSTPAPRTHASDPVVTDPPAQRKP
jgi:defect-in-organelle-trafficking protein DotC